MAERRDEWLSSIFVGYLCAVLATVWLVPRLWPGVMPPGPWDFWWVFLAVTPHAAAACLWSGVRAGRFSRWAVGLFWAAAVALGAFLTRLSLYLYTYAK